jgi:hypothetical protein
MPQAQVTPASAGGNLGPGPGSTNAAQGTHQRFLFLHSSFVGNAFARLSAGAHGGLQTATDADIPHPLRLPLRSAAVSYRFRGTSRGRAASTKPSRMVDRDRLDQGHCSARVSPNAPARNS